MQCDGASNDVKFFLRNALFSPYVFMLGITHPFSLGV